MSSLFEIRRDRVTGRYAIRSDRHVNTGEAWTALDDHEQLRPNQIAGWETVGTVANMLSASSPAGDTTPPPVWWSENAAREDPDGLERGLLWEYRGRVHYVPQRALGYQLPELPADAVRLVPESEVDFVLAENERHLAQHAADVAEIERLRAVSSSSPDDTAPAALDANLLAEQIAGWADALDRGYLRVGPVVSQMRETVAKFRAAASAAVPDTAPSEGELSTTDAPFSDEQAERLTRWQASTAFHPMTCATHSDAELHVAHGILVCPVMGCEYVQRWAPGFMTDTEPPVGPGAVPVPADGDTEETR